METARRDLRVLHVLEAVEGGVARHVTDIVRRVDAEHTVVLPPERVGGFTDTTAAEAMEKCGAGIHFMATRGALAAERLLGRVTDRFVAVSETEADLARRLRIARPDRISVIPNGIDLDAPGPPPLDVRAELGIDGKTPVVGTISRLVPQKAPDVFIDAWAEVATSMPDARFVLV